MGIGIGVVLFVLGAIVYFALEINLVGMDDAALGIILMIAGVAAVVIGLIMNQQRARTKHVVEERHTGDTRRTDGV
ncbi:MAG: DUF6458 family protein [Nocardioides sp.]|nr:DUF6458 family protein [Nocardioides sp.]